ncbi:hypothetical protein [Ornithinibacillus californiensis]|uniref:hypothetical protein n=1 Tax=Ornithinibacillus californiensis TaxID=161536 RepID=UPI00064DE474|nr:hypothetical protein [Ornithinibacillus californiensis]
MPQLSPEEKREIVREELHQLVKARYINMNIAAKIVNAHAKYYKNTPRVNEIKQEIVKPEVSKVEPKVTISPQPEPVQPKKEVVQPKPVIQPKKKLSDQQIRDRNITWGLNLGVILLLLAGLVFATSTWDTLSAWAKTGLFITVAILFYGLAWFTSRILHITKTAFAFLVLGSLFLPIIVVSAGYYELFGNYLSLFGEGKFLYGALGTLLVLPIYAYFAMKLSSRLFVWFSYVALSVFVGLLIAALYLPIDGFYLGIMLYNAALIVGYRLVKGNAKLKQFTKEFISFIQANLILSTLLTLVFYDNELMYSFNLLLTAVIYFSMIFVTNQKSYHFVFTAMLIYSAYQLVENSILVGAGEIAYALLGVLFLALPKLVKEAGTLQKVFQITSAVVSSLAFLYISFEGLILRMGEGSLVLLIAYIIIALNFAYLASLVKNELFNYLSPIFIISALYQLTLLGQQLFDYESIILPGYTLAFLFYIVGGCLLNVSLWKPLKTSTRDVSSLAMLIGLLVGLVTFMEFELSVMLFLLAALAIIISKYETRKEFAQIAPWLHPIALGFAVAVLYFYVVKPDDFFRIDPFQAEGIIYGSLAVLAVSYLWKTINKANFSESSFYIAQLFYGLGILQSFMSEPTTRALITLGGIGMAFLLYRRTGWKAIPYVLSSIALLFYFSILNVIHDEVANLPSLFQWVEFVLGTILFLVVGWMIGKKDQLLRSAFYWIGQIYLPFALIVTALFNEADAVWAFLIATMIYAVTVRAVTKEWQIKTFFYAGWTILWVTLQLAIAKFEWNIDYVYTYLIISVLLFVSWMIGNEIWKKRIFYYFVPFSSIGILGFTMSYPYDVSMFVITILYGALVLFVLHRMKWDILSAIPLFNMYSGMLNFSNGDTVLAYEPYIQAAFGVVLLAIGRVLYQTLYQMKGKYFKLDWYTIFAFIAFFNLYQFTILTDNLAFKVLPGILIVGGLLMNRKRVADISSTWLTFAAFVLALQPYYALLGHVELPALFEREFYVLPWIAVVIVLRNYVMRDNKELTNYIQWAVLVIVALLLVQDGLASNTIYDALIVGVLSLASLVAGMVYQMKSFFFVGAGVLLFNVFMQTRPYWGNVPWWGYLLIAGSILIAIASYNEWQKQKSSEGKETLVSKFKKNVIERMKNWD